MLKNWYIRMAIASIILIIGGIVQNITDIPYITYLGVFLMSVIFLWWVILVIVAMIKTRL
jgi:hypothetical protein